MKLSIVIPVYNGGSTISELTQALKIELTGLDFEIILVNDGSKDNSEVVCEGLAKKDNRVNVLSLRNNFGEHNAVMCGLNVVTGDYVVVIDDDFQNPPSEIRKLLGEAISGGYDVVYSRYKTKHHHWFRNVVSKGANIVASFVLNKPLSLYLSSFKLLNRETVNEIIKYKGANVYLDGLLLRTTNNIGTYDVIHAPRKRGESNYNTFRLFSLFMNMFINHSIRPIRMFMLAGFLILMFGAAMFFYFLDAHISLQSPALNWKLFLSGSLALAGFNTIVMCLIGEYIGKNIVNTSSAPQFTIKKAIMHNAKHLELISENPTSNAESGRGIR